MINLIEKARKSAGIASLERDVPPKGQRGAIFWGKFVTAVRTHFESVQQELFECKSKIADQAALISRLQGEMAQKDRLLIRHGLEITLGKCNSVSADERQQLLSVAN